MAPWSLGQILGLMLVMLMNRTELGLLSLMALGSLERTEHELLLCSLIGTCIDRMMSSIVLFNSDYKLTSHIHHSIHIEVGFCYYYYIYKVGMGTNYILITSRMLNPG